MKSLTPRHITPMERLYLIRDPRNAYRGAPVYHYRVPLLDRHTGPWRIVGMALLWLLVISLVIGFVAELLGPSSAEAAPEPDLIHVINHVAFVTDTETFAPLLVAIATCESHLDPLAHGREGSLGMFQFQVGTWAWASARAGFPGASALDPLAATYTAAWLISHPAEGGGSGHWSACLPRYWWG